jgi:hypothetical protein
MDRTDGDQSRSELEESYSEEAGNIANLSEAENLERTVAADVVEIPVPPHMRALFRESSF